MLKKEISCPDITLPSNSRFKIHNNQSFNVPLQEHDRKLESKMIQ